MAVSRVLIDNMIREVANVLLKTLMMLLVIIVYCRPRSIVSNLIHPAFLNSMHEWEGNGRCDEGWDKFNARNLRGRKQSFDCDRGKKILSCLQMYECMRRESCHGKNNLSPGYILSGSSATTMFASTTASGERP